MSRVVRHPASFLSLALFLLTIPLAVRFLRPATAAAAQASSSTIQVAMLRAGLNPKALASAGVDGGEASAVLAEFQSAFQEGPTLLASADEAYAKLRVQTDALARKVQSGLASEAEVAALATSSADLAAAEAKREDVLNNLFAAATAPLAPAKQTTLQDIRANADWDVPTEFLVAARTQEEWVKLRDALSNEKICAKYDDPVNAQLAGFLSQCRSEAPVALAKSACDANLASVQQALAATSGE